jgi:MinD-like ATPase involved in chromosome partitioning or flagellar assembly
MRTLVSFYSDRAGIGRSMVVATIGWILAINGIRVAMLDWDLRKPTLHKYLRPFLPDPSCRSVTGVIDLLWDYARLARRASTVEPSAIVPESAKGIGCECTIPAQLELKGGGQIHFIPAGAEGMRPIRESYFSWAELVDRLRGSHALHLFFDGVATEYDIVLIDLPSGPVTEAISLPAVNSNLIFVCFTLDSESIDAASRTARWFSNRLGNADLTIFPVATMVDYSAEYDLLCRAREYAKKRFEWLNWDELALRSGRSSTPFTIPELPYIPYYKYNRRIPHLTKDPSSLAQSCLRLAISISLNTELDLPDFSEDDLRKYEDEFADTHAADDTADNHPLPRPYDGDESYAFISYAREDQDQVLDVARNLALLEFRVWWDQGILAGSEWEAFLQTKISRCRHLLLFLSARSATSLHVARELATATALGKPVLTVRLDWTEIGSVHKEYLSKYQILDRRSPGFEEKLGRAMFSLHPNIVAT